jgi:hypothetical protein
MQRALGITQRVPAAGDRIAAAEYEERRGCLPLQPQQPSCVHPRIVALVKDSLCLSGYTSLYYVNVVCD